MAGRINQFLDNWFAWLIPASWEAPGYILAALIHVFLLINVLAVGAALYIWLERKVSGRIQDRFGPTRVGGKFGWLQVAADGIKLLAKEDVMPDSADPLLFRISPYLSLAASFTAFLALPFATGWVGQHVNVAVFFVLAVLGLEVFGVILAGYASGSKWSLFGGMREAAQVVSYEVPLGLCVLIPVMICGTMDLTAIANMQAGWFTNWLIFHDPATFVVFWIYFACAMASVNRAPFDLAEAESELVAGFHTEYSGMRWSIFFMAEYGSMFVVSALAAILFFGGWHGPIPIMAWASYGAGDTEWNFWGYLANLAGCGNMLLKGSIGVVVMIWVRWTLPRLRIDQVITMCWKYCVPIAAMAFLGVLGWQYAGLWSPNDLVPGPVRGEVRESWVTTGAAQLDIAAGKGSDGFGISGGGLMLLAAINWHTVFFMLFAAFACAFALGVLFAQNVVRMAFYLIVSLASTAALFMLAGAEFVGAMQIMIYVGGTLVLLIFGVMLTAQANFISLKTRAGEWILAAIFGGSLLVLLLAAAFSVPEWRSPRADQAQIPAAETKAATPLGLGLLGVRVDKLAESDATLRAGMSGYLLPFEIISVHLLVVLVGAAYLARTKRRVTVE